MQNVTNYVIRTHTDKGTGAILLRKCIINGDERHPMYNLIDIATIYPNIYGLSPIDYTNFWIQNEHNIGRLTFWEEYHGNFNFTGIPFAQFQEGTRGSKIAARKFLASFYGNLKQMTMKKWVEMTNSIGIFSPSGTFTDDIYAHETIASMFTADLSPKYSLHVIETICDGGVVDVVDLLNNMDKPPKKMMYKLI